MFTELETAFISEFESLATTALTNALSKDATLPASVKQLILASPQALGDLATTFLAKYSAAKAA